jgi:hypothetical protein
VDAAIAALLGALIGAAGPVLIAFITFGREDRRRLAAEKLAVYRGLVTEIDAILLPLRRVYRDDAFTPVTLQLEGFESAYFAADALTAGFVRLALTELLVDLQLLKKMIESPARDQLARDSLKEALHITWSRRVSLVSVIRADLEVRGWPFNASESHSDKRADETMRLHFPSIGDDSEVRARTGFLGRAERWVRSVFGR